MMTNLQEEHIAAHPGFPWLEAGGVEQLERLLSDLNWLRKDERLVSCDKAGEGNMNLTLRVCTDQRSMILKQARPWVEKYPEIAAPWDRSLFEQRFYERVSTLPEVAEAMPRILASDPAAKIILLEDLGEAQDFTDLYTGRRITEDELRSLARYLRALHDQTRGRSDPGLANREMRALNHQHIFVVPLQADNGVDLDIHELWLSEKVEGLREDPEYCAAVQLTGERYLEDGPCLVHGDYFPGSWLAAGDAIKVIDPEFCFYGDAEFDLGVCLAHLRMSEHDLEFGKAFLSAYVGSDTEATFDPERVGAYAAIEVMRRIIGVAQLPIPQSLGLRARLLKRSREALLSRSVEALWP